MIDARELRIGNWVKLTNHPHWSEKYKGTYECVDFDVLKEIEFNKEKLYEPIPLTKEILEKCDCSGIIITENCKYLHQLQNLIFALTQKEIEINL